MQLRRGVRVVRRGPGEVQIGTDPRWAVRLRDLPAPTAERLLQVGDRPLDGLLPPALTAQLADVGLLRPTPRRRHPPVPGTAADGRGYALAGDGDDLALLRRRARAAVRVVGLDRVGVVAATTLAAAGVGTVAVEDDRPVGVDDLGAGIGHSRLGHRRADAVRALLREQAPRVRVHASAGAVPDVVVTVGADATDPATALRLATAEVPHLPVVVREADAVVGPFARPGAAPCVRCVELHRADLDPAWPLVLAQLVAREAAPGVPAALAAVVGGLAAAEVLRHVDGGTPRTSGHQYEVPLPSVEPRLRRWAAHPDCGCTALPA